MNSRLILKASIITLGVPGSAIFLLPYAIMHRTGVTHLPDVSVVSFLAIIAGLTGLAVLLFCITGFAVHGNGTLAPIDPPKVLIIRGPYRYTRNPMYLAVVSILLSEALFFNSSSLLIYAVGVFLCFHLFVRIYEERHLRSQFGKSYEDYCVAVPRWLVTTRGYTPTYPV
jgi:protein-S-isoprenylcysteine O-methyltransferase Ste14